MPHTLLVSFSLLALVVTARPIAPVSYVFYGDQCRSQLTHICVPAAVITRNLPRFETPSKLSSRTAPSSFKYFHPRSPPILINVFRQSDINLFGLTQGEVDIQLISDERQQAVLSQLDGSAVKALVPFEGAESTMPPEVQKLREMLGGSKHLDDIEGATLDEIENDAETPAPAVKESETPTTSSPWASARALTGLSLTSLLAVYTFISLAAVLYAFYLIRGLLPPSRGEEEEKQPLRPGDVESGYTDEKGTGMGEEASNLDNILGTGTEFHDATEDKHSPSTPHPAPPEVPAVVEQPWSIPLPPSPPSSPLQQTIQLDEDAPVERNTQPACAMVASDEQRRPDARPGDAAPAIEVALAMQLRTGFGATADAAWLMRFLMAMFGWIAVFIGGGGERQATGRRLLQL
jgi:hypothetical protein